MVSKKGYVPWNKGLSGQDYLKHLKNHKVWNKGLTKKECPQFSNSGVKKGNIPWNKGLTKQTDSRVNKGIHNLRNKGKTYTERYGEKRATIISSKISYSLKRKNLKRCIPLEVRKRISDTLKETYIREGHPSCGKKFPKELYPNMGWRKTRKKQIFPIKNTKIESKIQNFLRQLNIEFFTHYYLYGIEHGYQCDIFIPSMNLVLECDGDYWHSYPTGRDIDHIRTKELIEKGFKVLRLWECEIMCMNLNDFKNKIGGLQ